MTMTNNQNKRLLSKNFEKNPQSVKRYKCQVCSKEFTTNFALRRHGNIHQNQDENLKNMLESSQEVGPKATFKPLKCQYCDKRFALKQYLKEHQYTHTGERPYICNINGCQKSFRQGGKLSLHRRKHPQYQKKEYFLANKRKGNKEPNLDKKTARKKTKKDTRKKSRKSRKDTSFKNLQGQTIKEQEKNIKAFDYQNLSFDNKSEKKEDLTPDNHNALTTRKFTQILSFDDKLFEESMFKEKLAKLNSFNSDGQQDNSSNQLNYNRQFSSKEYSQDIFLPIHKSHLKQYEKEQEDKVKGPLIKIQQEFDEHSRLQILQHSERQENYTSQFNSQFNDQTGLRLIRSRNIFPQGYTSPTNQRPNQLKLMYSGQQSAFEPFKKEFSLDQQIQKREQQERRLINTSILDQFNISQIDDLNEQKEKQENVGYLSCKLLKQIKSESERTSCPSFKTIMSNGRLGEDDDC